MNHEVNDNQSLKNVLENNKLVLVDFFAPWCGPCKMLLPIIDKLALKLKDEVKVIKVNVDDHKQLANEMNVSSIPDVILFKNSVEVERFKGYKPEEFIINLIEKHK